MGAVLHGTVKERQGQGEGKGWNWGIHNKEQQEAKTQATPVFPDWRLRLNTGLQLRLEASRKSQNFLLLDMTVKRQSST